MRTIRAITLLVALLVMLATAGCGGSEARVGIAIDIQADGTVVERITVRGAEISADALAAVEQTGWSIESTSPVELSHEFADAADLSDMETDALEEVLVAFRDDLRYEPTVRADSVLTVETQDYILARKVSAEYEPALVDFEPPYCTECIGSGEHGCETCAGEGSVSCPDCAGEGDLTCADCEGEGTVTCDSCEGDGSEVCSSCDGEGWTECYWCDGDGTTTDWWTDAEVACDNCGGDGKDDCGSCDGEGSYECWSCEGSGSLSCSTCDETGRTECYTCEQSGAVICEDCEGAGALNCESCSGTGEVSEMQLAAYEQAMSDARVDVAVNLPGYVPSAQEADGSLRITGLDISDTQSVARTSWVVNWLWAGIAAGLILVMVIGAGWATVRGVRRFGRRNAAPVAGQVAVPAVAATEVPAPAASMPPAAITPAAAATHTAGTTCAACSETNGEDARFCRSCGAPL